MKILILILLLISCSAIKQSPIVYDTAHKTVIKYDTVVKIRVVDSIVWHYINKDTAIFFKAYIPDYLKDKITSGQVKYIIQYK